MLDEFEINSCKCLGIILIKIVGYASFGNDWITILILSGVLEQCFKSMIKQFWEGGIIPETFPKVESKSQEFF